jgi:hypothetical protein
MIKRLFITIGNLHTDKKLNITPVNVINIYEYKGLYFFTHKSKLNINRFKISELSTGMSCSGDLNKEYEALERVVIAIKNTDNNLFAVVKKSLNKLKEVGLKKIPVNELTKEIKKYAEEIEL